MSYNNFKEGTVITIDGSDYMPEGYAVGRLKLCHMTTGAFFVCGQGDGTVGLPNDAQFDDLLLSGRATIRSLFNSEPVRKVNSESEWTDDQVAAIDPKANKMLAVCRLLDEAGVPNGDGAIRKHLETHWTAELVEEFGPFDRPRTIRSWRKKRGRPGQRHPRHMVRLNGHSSGAFNAHTDQVKLQWLVAMRCRKEGSSVRKAHGLLAYEIAQINAGAHPTIAAPQTPWKVCSNATMRRRYNALESSDTLPTSIEKQAREQDWLGAGAPLSADFAMQRVIIDHTRFDVHVIDPKLEMVLGRPWLTLAIDVKSRACVGHLITFIDPSTWTLGEILRRTVLPKRPPKAMLERYPILAKLRGKPGEIIVDNAVEFRSQTMEAAARNAGFSVRFCPIKQPRYRAICERAIGTINGQIVDGMKGRTLTIHDARRFGYNAEDHGIVLLDELEAISNQVIAEYNISPHSGLEGRQPALIFEKDLNRFGINNFIDFESFARDTMQVVQDAQLSPSGIRAFGCLRYHDIKAVPALLNDLVPLEARRQRRDDATATVQYRFNPMNISKIHVWNRKTRKYVALQCADERYTDGMPVWLHERIREIGKAESAAFNTEEERLEARGRLVQAIRSISPTETLAARKRVAELLEIPRLRQITGNLVHLAEAEPEPVSLGEFIANDRAAETSLDHEILSARPALRQRETTRSVDSRRKQAKASQQQLDAPAPAPRRRVNAGMGGYE